MSNISVKVVCRNAKLDAQVGPQKLSQTANVFSMKYSCTIINMYIVLFVFYYVWTGPEKYILFVSLLTEGRLGIL